VFGFSGQTSNFQADNPDNTAKPFHISYDYTRKDYGGNDGKQFTPPLPPVPFLMGENNKPPEDFIPLGAAGERDYRATITLPKGDVATLVADKTVKTDFAEYRETSSVKDGKLIAERYLKVETPKLPAARWEEYLKFEKTVQDRENLMVSVAAGNTSLPATGTHYVQEAHDLVDQAYQAAQANQLARAIDLLKRAQEINPTQWGLSATYGDVYLKQNEKDRAIDSYRQEMKNHPDNLRAGRMVAGMLISMKRVTEAAEVLQNLLQQSPDDSWTLQALAYVRLQQKRYEDAVVLWKRLAAKQDSTPETHVSLGGVELEAGDREAGIAELETAMHSAQKPMTINNAAYDLADHDADLPEAQQFTQEALQQIEVSSSKATLTTLTNDDLTLVAEMGDIWDTVGWIDYKLGHYAEAELYFRAAWTLSQHGVVADHLGQTYQKEGKPTKAAHIYRLALSAADPGDKVEIRKRLDALEAGPPTTVGSAKTNDSDVPEDSSKLRTFPVPAIPKQFALAEFFVLLGPDGVEDVQFITGKESLRRALPRLRKIDFGMVFPDTGPEKIVRRGVLSCSSDTAQCDFVLLLPQIARVK
jgi:tetratricopeptide (TPR) repeat protein